MIHDVLERITRAADEVLADAVEHDDRVVYREADDRQHRHDKGRLDLDGGREQAAQDREDAQHDQRIVEQRGDSGGPVAQRMGDLVEGPPQVQQDAHRGGRDRQDGVAHDLFGDERRDLIEVQDLQRAEASSERLLDLLAF